MKGGKIVMLLYYTRGTASADGSYYPEDPRLVEAVFDHRNEIPELDIISHYFKAGFNASFENVVLKPTTGNKVFDRAAQLYLFQLIGWLVERQGRCSFSAIGFYSAGVIPASVHNGLYDLESSFIGMRPFLLGYYSALDKSETKLNWRQALVIGAEPLVNSLSYRKLANANVDELFLKDCRSERAALVAGEQKALSKFLQCIGEEIELSHVPNVDDRPINAAHTPVLSKADYRTRLDSVAFYPPRFPMLSARGDWLMPNVNEVNDIRDFFFDAITGGLNTQQMYRVAVTECKTILAIGSQRSLKNFDGVEFSNGCEPKLVTSVDIR